MVSFLQTSLVQNNALLSSSNFQSLYLEFSADVLQWDPQIYWRNSLPRLFPTFATSGQLCFTRISILTFQPNDICNPVALPELDRYQGGMEPGLCKCLRPQCPPIVYSGTMALHRLLALDHTFVVFGLVYVRNLHSCQRG